MNDRQLSLPFGRPYVVKDVLGRERMPSKVWSDGSYNCPFCFATANITGCGSPACLARVEPPYPVERAREQVALAEGRERDELERTERNADQARRAEATRIEQARERERITAEAKRRGACAACALQDFPYRAPKYTKHRTPCPRRASTPRGSGGVK